MSKEKDLLSKLSKPTRSMIERLFRELAAKADGGLAEYQRLNQEIRRLQSRLLNVPEMKRLKKMSQKAHDAWCKSRKERRRQLQELRTEYLANGLTPDVHKKINSLVAAFQKLN